MKENDSFRRNQEIIAAAQTGQQTLEEIAVRNEMTKERVRQILKDSGYNILAFRKLRRQTEEEKQPHYQQLVDTLMQYYFEKLIVEKGENYALAWRCQEIFHNGKNLSIEQITLLIEARRAGEGYYRCIKYAGITYEKNKVMARIPYVKYLLKSALRDLA
jgi:hypothetical protein